MEAPLSVTLATYVSRTPDMVALQLSDGTCARLYLNCGFPRYAVNDLLDQWLADGNEIQEP